LSFKKRSTRRVKGIEGGKEFPGKNLFFGDFDVFRSVRLSGSQSAPQPSIVDKKQLKIEEPYPPETGIFLPVFPLELKSCIK